MSRRGFVSLCRKLRRCIAMILFHISANIIHTSIYEVHVYLKYLCFLQSKKNMLVDIAGAPAACRVAEPVPTHQHLACAFPLGSPSLYPTGVPYHMNLPTLQACEMSYRTRLDDKLISHLNRPPLPPLPPCFLYFSCLSVSFFFHGMDSSDPSIDRLVCLFILVYGLPPAWRGVHQAGEVVRRSAYVLQGGHQGAPRGVRRRGHARPRPGAPLVGPPRVDRRMARCDNDHLTRVSPFPTPIALFARSRAKVIWRSGGSSSSSSSWAYRPHTITAAQVFFCTFMRGTIQ